MASNITLAITSCDRHDLLKQTIDSFLATSDMTPEATIIVEDSRTPMPAWVNEQPYRSLRIQWIASDSRMGQIYSIDRLYSEIKTDYIFHCEDDWLFTDSSGWMLKSKQILDSHPEVFMVSLRGHTGWHPLINRGDLLIAEPGWRGGWGGISFNCGLRRLSDYKKLGSYGRHVAYGTHGLGHEMQLSQKHLAMGYVIADLGQPIVEHTGAGRSRAIEPLGTMPRVLIAVPACHKFDYGKWESSESPLFDVAKAYRGQAYGTDIHISGDNNRIQAVRDTWFRDIEPFKAHVDAKLFYGQPHPRPALEDEVYLACGDDYEHLPLKTIEIARYAHENNYDYLFKCDDDTAVYVDRLIHELMSYKFDYAGCEHHGVCTGGPGYWLSRRAMKALIENSRPDHWAEDVWTAKVMGYANINPFLLPGHKPGGTNHWFFANGFDPSVNLDDLVTFHAVQPDVLRDWYQYTHR